MLIMWLELWLMGIAGLATGRYPFIGACIIGFAILIPILWFRRSSNDYQGRIGERQVASILSRLKRYPGEYFVFNNVLLQNEHHSSEIDHVVISRYGIFSIETKAYARAHITEDGRWFSGQDTDRARDLGDPLKQNRGHIKALRAVLGDAKYLSCVVLTRASLSGNVPSGVVTLESLNEVIRSHREIVLDESRVRSLVGELERVNKTDKDARKEHIRRVQEKKRLAQAGDFIDE